MKIFTFAHRLEVGGTQVNAIELAEALRDRHQYEIVFFATPGPMIKLLTEKGLRYLPAPDARFHPSTARVRALRRAVQQERPDVLHVWDWWQCTEAYYFVHLPQRIPMIVTDMMMSLTRLLPKQLPTTFGTPEVVDNARASGRKCVELMLPPVDVQLNAPGAADGSVFRQAHGIADGEVLLVTICRLSPSMKSEGLVRTMDAVRVLGRDVPVRFVIVGEGVARARLEERANEVNTELGRPAILVARGLIDPRPAYAAADIVLGMGGSSLRGMAFGKPVIIVGEAGFSAPFTPVTAPGFYYKGMYGLGNGNSNNASLAREIRNLAEDAEQRAALGQFSRNFVVQHFDLRTVSSRFAELCRRTATAGGPQFPNAAVDAIRTAAVYFRERRFLTPSRAPGPEVSPTVSS